MNTKSGKSHENAKSVFLKSSGLKNGRVSVNSRPNRRNKAAF